MKKVLSVVVFTGIVFGFQQSAYAGHNHDQKDYYKFRKIVHILDDLLNDDYRYRSNYYKVNYHHKPHYHGKKVCYFTGHGKFCYKDSYRRNRHWNDNYHAHSFKRRKHGRRSYGH